MAQQAKPLPPLTELQQRYSYCPDSGELRFRQHLHRNKIGSLVGGIHPDKNTNYLRVNHNGRLILVHRICYYLGTGKEPKNCIDHINGNGLDNRLSNLRDVTNKINSRNQHSTKSSSGFRGVYWYPRGGYFTAKLYINDKLKQLGYGDLLHCAALRLSAEREHGYVR